MQNDFLCDHSIVDPSQSFPATFNTYNDKTVYNEYKIENELPEMPMGLKPPELFEFLKG
jgi:hypothetical protein